MVETVDYQAVLADLKARRARLDDLIVGIEAVIVGQTDAVDLAPAKPGGHPMPTIHPDTFFGLGIAEAAKKYLGLAKRAQHTAAIADALARGGLKRPADNALSSILIRAAKGRGVVKVGKGMWGLSDWYPKRPVEPAENRRRRPKTERRAKLVKLRKALTAGRSEKADAASG